jgi:hypothetical protein
MADTKWVSSKVVARRLGVTGDTIVAWAKKDQITAFYITPGGIYRFNLEGVVKELGVPGE